MLQSSPSGFKPQVRVWPVLLALLFVPFSSPEAGISRFKRTSPRICRAALIPPSRIELQLPRVNGRKSWGLNFRVAANPFTRNISELRDLVLVQYNVENLLERTGRYSRSPKTGKFVFDPMIGDYQRETPALDKPVAKLMGIADALQRANPDVAVLEEVESLDAVEYLNEKYLGGKYIAILIPGNDERRINIAFLIKGDLPFDLEVQSFKNVARSATQPQEPLFSRDLPAILFREKGAAPDAKPLFAVLGTHYKSQRDQPGDPLSERWRREQVEGTVAIINNYQSVWGPELPVFLMGDFNRDVRAGPEFRPLWQKARMKDAFDIAPVEKSLPLSARITQTFHPRDEAAVYNQLDSVVASLTVQTHSLIKEAMILPYLNQNGRPKPIPRSIEERDQNPSDHLLLRVVLDFKKLFMLHSSANPLDSER